MTPEFSKLVDPIFLAVLRLVQRLERDERVDLHTERSNIRNLIDEAEKKVTQPNSRVRREEFELAKQGLVYWADEILTEAAPDYKNLLLEIEYYGPPRKRAWKFYADGESKARHSTPDVAEVWYLALALGFKGDIRDAFRTQLNRDLPGGTNDADEARRIWARELAGRIRDSRLPDLAGEPLHCDVPPHTGRALSHIAIGIFSVFVLILGLLVFLPEWLGPERGSNAIDPALRGEKSLDR